MRLHIDELTLSVPTSPENGRRLAELVGHGLSSLPSGLTGDLSSLRVTIDAHTEEPLEATAERVVAAMRRTLASPT